MARPRPTNQAEWEQEGAEAILDLVKEKLVVPALTLVLVAVSRHPFSWS